MTDTEILKWIKNNLGAYINAAIDSKKSIDPDLIYTEDWLGSLTCREVGGLINRYISAKPTLNAIDIAPLMRGDYSQRPGETEKQFHGYGYPQIDIASFPDFVKSGDWKIPFKCFLKCIDVLEGKRKYLASHSSLIPNDQMEKYITAAYNCGEGNEVKVINRHLDVDAFDTNHNYAKEVFQFREIYLTL